VLITKVAPDIPAQYGILNVTHLRIKRVGIVFDFPSVEYTFKEEERF
jgi:hypothetical protein